MSLPANQNKEPSKQSQPAKSLKEPSQESPPVNLLKEHSQESQILCPDPDIVSAPLRCAVATLLVHFQPLPALSQLHSIFCPLPSISSPPPTPLSHALPLEYSFCAC